MQSGQEDYCKANIEGYALVQTGIRGGRWGQAHG